MLLLVSQTVTQKDIHIKNLTELVEMLEAEGLRDKVILACGGPPGFHMSWRKNWGTMPASG